MARHRPVLALVSLLIGTALSGCVIERTYAPAGGGTALAIRTVPSAAWTVADEAGRAVGFVVCFVDPYDQGARHFSVRDEDHCELGTLDAAGRAWRYRPHRREAEFLGGGTVAECAARILGRDRVNLERIRFVGAALSPLQDS